MIVGSMLRAYREKQKLSLRELARMIGVDFTTLSRFENGKAVTTDAWVAIIKWILTTNE